MSINKTSSGIHTTSHDRALIDAYKIKGTLAEPSVCSQCSAVYKLGHWQWHEAPANAQRVICPACHRLNDNFPAGFVNLHGPFLIEHAEEIWILIQHHAEFERIKHPLKRIIAIDNKDGAMLVTTTDTDLARGIGEAIHHAYQGELKIDHVAGESRVRVDWKR
jgi:hypothetical protein